MARFVAHNKLLESAAVPSGAARFTAARYSVTQTAPNAAHQIVVQKTSLEWMVRHHLEFSPGSYFRVSDLALTSADRNAVSFVALVRIPPFPNAACYYLDNSILSVGANKLAMSLGVYSDFGTFINFKLNGNSSGNSFNPPSASLSAYAGKWVVLECGFETLANGSVRTFYKADGSVVTEKTSDSQTATGGWGTGFQLGNGNSYSSSGNCEISWVEIRSGGVAVHHFDPRKDLMMVDALGGAKCVRVGSGFVYH